MFARARSETSRSQPAWSSSALGGTAVVCALAACGARSELRDATPIRAPRAIAPLSTSRVTTQRPRFAWQAVAGQQGAVIEICRTASCEHVEQRVTATGDHLRLAAPLAAGVWFWRLRGVRDGLVGYESSVAWEFRAPMRDHAAASSGGTFPDFNRDGYGDLVLGSPEGSFDLDVYLGSPDGLPSSPSQTFALSIATSIGAGPAGGSAGDVNGDGYADLYALQYGPEGHQPVVLLGGTEGLSLDRVWSIPLGSPSWISISFLPIVPADDVDADGYADLAITDWYNVANEVPGIGLVNGGSSALSLGVMRPGCGSGADGQSINGASARGDFDADGFSELVVSQTVQGGCAPASQSCVLEGAADGPAIEPGVRLSNAASAHVVAGAPSVGDVDGDGYLDMVSYEVCAPLFAGADAFALRRGGPGGLESSPSDYFTSADLGDSPSVVGDINGDGFDDAVSTPRSSAMSSDAPPIVTLMLGGPTGVALHTRVVLTLPAGATTSSVSETPPAALGDVNGDGFEDFAATFFRPIVSPTMDWVSATAVYLGGNPVPTVPSLVLAGRLTSR